MQNAAAAGLTRPPSPNPLLQHLDAALARLGDALLRGRRVIQAVQWVVVAVYLVLITVPALLPLPVRAAHIWNHITLFAQFVFWGLWWPFVLLSMVLVGRAWCGLICPEGSLTQFASRHGRGNALPHWIKWKGWPFVAFAMTTIYGQLISVYQYPAPALLILGGSTLAAIVIGFLYGRNKRVWCRYLCPVTGVFGLLTKLAPLHFRVDPVAWEASRQSGVRPRPVNCPPLVPIKTMRGSSMCHMCGGCSGYRGAISLSRRSPNDEIVRVAKNEPKPWETALILFGLMGVAAGAFHWTGSDTFVEAKQAIATLLVEHGVMWPLALHLPWFLLTNYPDNNDVLTPLDGALIVAYIGAVAVLVGVTASTCLALAARALGPWQAARFHHLAQGLLPSAGCGVFLGLSALTVTMLHSEGFALGFVTPLRLAFLTGAALWSAILCWQIAAAHTASRVRQAIALLPTSGAIAIGVATWALLFWG
ncbi:MAG: 4Fe-4S binding protein [Methylobacteriaceae bacterium]|nr:4Fe-4S binding protein [Methylobacteriaceae bacterium]